MLLDFHSYHTQLFMGKENLPRQTLHNLDHPLFTWGKSHYAGK
jgi:hypothetical protein